MTPRTRRHHRTYTPAAARRRRGTILIVTMLIVFSVAAMVVVFCRSMRVEAIASANLSASLQASGVERGAEQYVISLLTEQKDTLADITEDYFEAGHMMYIEQNSLAKQREDLRNFVNAALKR